MGASISMVREYSFLLRHRHFDMRLIALIKICLAPVVHFVFVDRRDGFFGFVFWPWTWLADAFHRKCFLGDVCPSARLDLDHFLTRVFWKMFARQCPSCFGRRDFESARFSGSQAGFRR
jgi:hypothetical protein